MTAAPKMTTELERDLQAERYWNKGFIQDRMGFKGYRVGLKGYAEYLATIPELPESVRQSETRLLILVDPRVNFDYICRKEIAGFSASNLSECDHGDFGPPSDRAYWMLVHLIEHPEDQLIRETIKAISEGWRGCTLMEGFAIRIQEYSRIRDRQLVLPGSRYYGPPEDHYFRGVLRPNGQFAPICTDVRMQALIAVTDRRIYM